MKTISLDEMTRAFGKVPKQKTLSQIIRDVQQTRAAINPYTIVAENIIKNLRRYFVFPFLQPNVINPLELQGYETLFMHDENGNGKFRPARLMNYSEESEMGMDPLIGIKMAFDDKDMPYFIRPEDLSTEIGSVDYRVYDYGSFQKFIKKLIKDMSFFKPMLRSAINTETVKYKKRKLRKGDIVLVPGQTYSKMGIVSGTGRKEYLTKFYSHEGFHSERIGVDISELAARDMQAEGCRLEATVRDMSISWVQDFNEYRKGRKLAIGSGAALIGRGNYESEPDSLLGYVVVTGLDPECAVVVPHSFDDNEIYPWGHIKELAIPSKELIRLGSLKEIKKGVDIYSHFFADDREIWDVVQEITSREIDNPQVKGLIAFSDLKRYQKLHQDLLECPQVPPSLVAPQFINILTKNGMDGIERLAQISGNDVIDIAKELLAGDLDKVINCWWVSRDIEKYAPFVNDVSQLVRKHTEFGSVERMLQFASPLINLYQIKRDGNYTIGYVETMGLSKSVQIEGREENEPREEVTFNDLVSIFDLVPGRNPLLDAVIMSGASPDRIVERINHEIREKNRNTQTKFLRKEFSFMDKDRIPKEGVYADKNGEIYTVLRIGYRILRKYRSVIYGRDENFNLTSPGPELINDNFKMHPFMDQSQISFLSNVFEQIRQKANFEGKDNFLTAYKSLVEKYLRSDDDDEDRYYRSERNIADHLLGEVRSLYNGISQITSNAEVKDMIIHELLGEKPMVLEAFYDYENLKKLMFVRDHYWRGNLRAKTQFLSQYGYPFSLGSSGFADEFYHALSWVDMFHRGFPTDEHKITNITRNNTSSYHDRSEKGTTLGLMPSTQATALLGSISNYTKQLSDDIRRGQVAGFLSAPDESD